MIYVRDGRDSQPTFVLLRARPLRHALRPPRFQPPCGPAIPGAEKAVHRLAQQFISFPTGTQGEFVQFVSRVAAEFDPTMNLWQGQVSRTESRNAKQCANSARVGIPTSMRATHKSRSAPAARRLSRVDQDAGYPCTSATSAICRLGALPLLQPLRNHQPRRVVPIRPTGCLFRDGTRGCFRRRVSAELVPVQAELHPPGGLRANPERPGRALVGEEHRFHQS